MGLLGGLLGDDNGFEAARQANAQNQQLYSDIQLPSYLNYTPELYNGETSNYTLTQDDPVLKSAQEAALNKLANLSDTGLSDVDAQGLAKARAEGNQFAKAGTAAAIQDAQNRGVGGSGMEFALRELANQGGATRANDSGMAQAAQAAQQRAQYNLAYGQQLGQTRDQDYRTNAANTNVINQFNQANTNQRNQTNAANVDQRNDAFKYNEGLKDKNYNNQMHRADSLAGINNRTGEIGAGQAAADDAKRRAIGGLVGAGAGALLGGPGGRAAGAAVGGQIGGSIF